MREGRKGEYGPDTRHWPNDAIDQSVVNRPISSLPLSHPKRLPRYDLILIRIHLHRALALPQRQNAFHVPSI